MFLLASLPSRGDQEGKSQEGRTGKPNVVWILFDALRAHNLSCYGYRRPTTPNLDRLAQEGVLFEWCFSQGYRTKVSVPSYCTGRYFPVFCHQPVKWTEILRRPPAGERFVTEMLRDDGYYTAMISTHKWFTAKSRLGHTFDELLILPFESKEPWIPASFEVINLQAFAWLAKNRERPFFLYIHSMDTHFPHIVEPPYDRWCVRRYRGGKFKHGWPDPPDTKEFSRKDARQMAGLYDGSLRYVDEQIGLLLKRLDELGLKDNTIVVITYDHGELLAEDGSTWGHVGDTRDWGGRVPLIMAGPGIPQGVRVSRIAENADIVPTLVEMLAIRTDAVFDGASLVPLFSPTQDADDAYAFAKRGKYDEPDLFVVRDAKYKYEYSVVDGSERLYKVPDEVATRRNILWRKGKVRDRMRSYLDDVILPRYEAYRQLPILSLSLFLERSMGSVALPRSAFIEESQLITEEAERDGKWSYTSALKMLWASPPHEDAPPLSLSFAVENGEYDAAMEILSCRMYMSTSSATAIRVKVENDSEFRRIQRDDGSGDRGEWVFVRLGTYTVDDGTFDVVVDDVPGDHLATVRSFRLTPASEQAAIDEDHVEELRALGYVD